MVTAMKYRSTYSMNLETPLVLPVLLLAILLAILSFPAQGAAETTDFDWQQETFATPAEAGQALSGGEPGKRSGGPCTNTRAGITSHTELRRSGGGQGIASIFCRKVRTDESLGHDD